MCVPKVIFVCLVVALFEHAELYTQKTSLLQLMKVITSWFGTAPDVVRYARN